jgi:hypothetical protein
LRQLAGFENFDERVHVLRCIKPGTGCKDAPRAFSLKLASVTQSDHVGLRPTTMDPELEVKHNAAGRLVALQGKHVDDIKIGAISSEMRLIITAIEKVFGKVTYAKSKFSNCGVRHTHLDNGDVVMDQDEYIAALIPISHADLTGAKSDTDCSEALKAIFWSLLGAVAYALLTQSWIAVYVIALQRMTHKPCIIHVRRLNVLTRALQQNPQKLIYPAMNCSQHIISHSDSAFARESDHAYAMRGANFMREGISATNEVVYHLIEATAQSHKLVVRSTFGAELFASTAAADSLIPLLVTMHELRNGVLTSNQAKLMRENGGLCYRSTLVVDAMSLFTAIAAHTTKIPTEKSLALHLFWLKQLLVKGIISVLRWADTRDMTADGHTKGKVSRDAQISLMQGHFKHLYEYKDYAFSGKATELSTTICDTDADWALLDPAMHGRSKQRNP